MEFDWINVPFEVDQVSPKEVEESFEDPFGIRILPDTDDVSASEARYFILGKSVSGRGLFTVFWTDGKRYRVIQSRQMTEAESGFYERKNADLTN
ncbi:hypothetical protein BH09VER1_BH09VER1_49880 [soil metagenome]